jgi:hypothetical protein
MGEHRSVSKRKNPIEQALDFFLFAPIGFVLSASETIPELAEKGRGYVTAARMMGEYAIGQGRDKAEQAVGMRRPSAPPPGPEGVGARVSAGEPVAPTTPPPPPAPEGAQARVDAAMATGGNGAGARPSPDTLAIPGYDTLSASQVVQRLGGLSGDELEAVRTYEEGGRRRKTILTRVAQLQSGS